MKKQIFTKFIFDFRYLALWIVVLISMSGCATVGSSGQVQNLQHRVSELERELAKKDQEIANLRYDMNIEESKEIVFDEDILKELEAKEKQVSKPKASTSVKSVKKTNRNIQRALKNAGYYKGRIDGKIGKYTKRAIRNFQRAKGLRADGVVGKYTWSRLKKYL